MKINDKTVIKQLEEILKNCKAMSITNDKFVYNISATHMCGKLEMLISLLEEGEADER